MLIALLISLPGLVLTAIISALRWRRSRDAKRALGLALVGGFFIYGFHFLSWVLLSRTPSPQGDLSGIELMDLWMLAEQVLPLLFLWPISLGIRKFGFRTIPAVLLALALWGFAASRLAHRSQVSFDRPKHGQQIRIDQDLCLSVLPDCIHAGTPSAGVITCNPGPRLQYQVIRKPTEVVFTHKNGLNRMESATFPEDGRVQRFIALSQPDQVLHVTAESAGSGGFGHTIVRKCLDHLVIE
jgi:hypothetical protein